MNHLDQQCSAIRDRLRRRGGSSGVARSAARSCPLRRRLPAEAPAGSGRWAAMPPAVGCDYHLNRVQLPGGTEYKIMIYYFGAPKCPPE